MPLSTQVVLNNTMYQHTKTDCSPAAVKLDMVDQWFTVGAANTVLMPDGVTVYIRGTQLLPLPLQPLGGGPSQGETWLHNYGSASKCVPLSPSVDGEAALLAGLMPWWHHA